MLARWGIWRLGGRDFVRDIVAQFVADAAAVLASLTAAVASRDSKGFREQANALRSCAANVGAQNVYRMCLAWRDLDAQEIASSGSKYMQILEAEFDRVRGAYSDAAGGRRLRSGQRSRMSESLTLPVA
jgi:two-component system sensor histidine kinase RpfC